MKRWMVNCESRTQKLGFWVDSWTTWRRDSSERRKNPMRELAGVPVAAEVASTDTPETAMETWPVWVKPNFSNRIMWRASDVIFRFLISATEAAMRERNVTATRRFSMVLAILKRWPDRRSVADLAPTTVVLVRSGRK